MTVTVYRSTDASAPVLTGEAGKVIELLDACLVNGYGTKPAAGFTKEFTGTNKAVYRAATGNRAFYRFGPGDTSNHTSLRVFQNMTDVDTGSDPSGPTVGLRIKHSSTTDTTARPWVLVTNGKLVYLLIAYTTGDSTFATSLLTVFGEFESFYSSLQSYCNIIVSSPSESASPDNPIGTPPRIGDQKTAGPPGAFIHRKVNGSYTGSTTSQCAFNVITSTVMNQFGNSSASAAYPDPITGGINLSPVFIGEASSPYYPDRGRLPGLWAPIHPVASFSDDSTFSGTGTLAGKEFLILRTSGPSGTTNQCNIVLEISDTW